jgi:hypothetical protein
VLALPIIAYFYWHVPLAAVLIWWFAGDLITFGPPVIYGCWKRKYPFWRAALSYPTWYMLKMVNMRWDVHMLIREMVLVPLHIAQPFTTYERGKA